MRHSNRYSGQRLRASQNKDEVTAKKFLGQHFLTDEAIARRIVESVSAISDPQFQLSTRSVVMSSPGSDQTASNVLEIGPGMGVLTKYMVDDDRLNLKCVEIDTESVAYLRNHYPSLQLVEGDFLKLDLSTLFNGPFTLIGNFPYNISSQILFKVYDSRDIVPEVVGMFQKEVAERIVSPPGNKSYGILSVLLSAYYDMEYLFTVPETVFNPPPKVKSAVIRLRRNSRATIDCDEELFKKVVKAGFNQRRKTLRNALKAMSLNYDQVPADLLDKRAEQLSHQDFEQITRMIQP